METILLIITFGSFLLIWIVMIIIYTPACFNLKTMIDSINKDGELTKTKAPFRWYLTNYYTLECWTISLPKTEKYLKYDIVSKTTNKIKISRNFLAYAALAPILCGFILLMTVR